MPVIGRADHDGVHVLVRKEVLVVAVRGDAVVLLARLLRVVLVDQRPRVLDAMAVEIADRHDPRGVVFPEPGQIVSARDSAVADRTDVDSIRRRECAEHRRGNDRRDSGYDGCRDEAFTGCGEKVTTRRGTPPFLSHV
jgi:hypothetical protein